MEETLLDVVWFREQKKRGYVKNHIVRLPYLYSVSVVVGKKSLWVVKTAHLKEYPRCALLPCQEGSHANTVASPGKLSSMIMERGNGRLWFLIMVG